MDKKKITLEKEKETLLIPLYCRALETKRKNPIISDPKAVEIISRIEYDFGRLKVNSGTYITTCMRGKKFDWYTKEFLAENPDGIVIYLGCGLDSRFERVDNGRVQWYDLDFPEVMDVRKLFYKENSRYHFISSSVVNLQWINIIPKNSSGVLILAEGLFMYLKEDEVKSLILTIQNAFPGSTLVFDCFSELTARKIGSHPAIKKMQARVYWGLDDPMALSKWNKSITLIEEWFFTQSEELKKLNLVYRSMFALAGCFAVARKAHRLLKYQL